MAGKGLRKLGFWGLLALAFAPSTQGVAATVQKAIRLPVNLAILWYFGSIILLFTSLWWLGLLTHIAWYFIIPRTIKGIHARVVGE